MGTSTSWAQLDAKLSRLAADYSDLPKSQVRESTVVVKKSVDAFMPNRLRGVGKRGAAINVRTNVTDDLGRVYVTGPAQLIENDTRPHRIPKERGSRARRRYAVIPGVGVRSSAHHPGTKGKHPWAKGVDAAVPIVKRLFEAKGALALRRIF